MPSSTARIPTIHGSKYLQQLCKHWSHRLTVKFDPSDGKVLFDDARQCLFHAEDEHLDLEVQTATGEELERTQGTVINHLRRFAFREELADPVWTRIG
jgi:uncharacterized protein